MQVEGGERRLTSSDTVAYMCLFVCVFEWGWNEDEEILTNVFIRPAAVFSNWSCPRQFELLNIKEKLQYYKSQIWVSLA